MPSECPNCRVPIPRYRLFITPVWGIWQCSGCGAVLGIDVRRRLLATIPWIAILFVLLFVVRITSLGLVIAAPMIIAAGVINFLLFDRAVVRERTGFRCRKCGYDLRGQMEGRCPECGSEFKLADLADYHAGDPERRTVVSRSRSRIALTIVLGVAVLLLTVGVMFLRSARVQAARQRTLAAQQLAVATQPAAADPPATVPASQPVSP